MPFSWILRGTSSLSTKWPPKAFSRWPACCLSQTPGQHRGAGVNKRSVAIVAIAALATATLAACGASSGSKPAGDSSDAVNDSATQSTATPDDAAGGGEDEPAADAPPVSALVLDHRELGTIIVDGAGMTLYVITSDQPRAAPTCTGNCAKEFPPFISPDLIIELPEAGVGRFLDTVERAVGVYQVTYQGLPLHYFIGDLKPTDAKGQGVTVTIRPDGSSDTWYVINTVAQRVGAPD